MKKILVIVTLIIFMGSSSMAQSKKHLKHHKHHKHMMKHKADEKKIKVKSE